MMKWEYLSRLLKRDHMAETESSEATDKDIMEIDAKVVIPAVDITKVEVIIIKNKAIRVVVVNMIKNLTNILGITKIYTVINPKNSSEEEGIEQEKILPMSLTKAININALL
jgi:hypothetical protein